MAISDIFNLKKQLVIYGSHHNNRVNVAIHMIFVPILLWTAFVMGARTGPLINVASLPPYLTWVKKFEPNLAFFTTVVYSVYYMILDPIAATLCAPILYSMTYSATRFLRTNSNATQIALAIHVISWIFQFIGHGVAEKRKPKLIDNIVQAFVLAPYFVFFEALFTFGYRPRLYKEVQVEIVEDIRKFRAAQKLKTKAGN